MYELTYNGKFDTVFVKKHECCIALSVDEAATLSEQIDIMLTQREQIVGTDKALHLQFDGEFVPCDVAVESLSRDAVLNDIERGITRGSDAENIIRALMCWELEGDKS